MVGKIFCTKFKVKDYNLTVENVTYVVQITDGHGNITFGNISAGIHEATLSFNGNARYLEKTFAIHYHITKLTPNINLTRTDNNVIVVSVDGNATGNISFIVNGIVYVVNLTNGNATLTNKLIVGNNSVIAIYNPDENHTATQTSRNYIIDKLNSTVNVTANNTAYGSPVTITVQVGKNQIGFVTISVNGKEYSAKVKNGNATFSINNLDINNYTVDVVYEGDDTYSNSTNHTFFNVTKAQLNVNVIGGNVSVSDNASFIIDVPNDFNGKVNITVDGKTYTRNVISIIEIAKLLAGNKNVTLVFYNSTKYNNKEVNTSFTVSRVVADINVTVEDVIYPANATAKINISNKANGTVEVYFNNTKIGNGTIANGIANINLNRLSGGVHEVVVKFITCDDYNENITTTAKFEVKKS